MLSSQKHSVLKYVAPYKSVPHLILSNKSFKFSRTLHSLTLTYTSAFSHQTLVLAINFSICAPCAPPLLHTPLLSPFPLSLRSHPGAAAQDRGRALLGAGRTRQRADGQRCRRGRGADCARPPHAAGGRRGGARGGRRALGDAVALVGRSRWWVDVFGLFRMPIFLRKIFAFRLR